MPDQVAPHPHPDLAGYVLGALDPGETAAFEQHLAGCDTCRAEVDELQGLPELMERAAPPIEVPPGLRQRTFAAVQQDARAEFIESFQLMLFPYGVLRLLLRSGRQVTGYNPSRKKRE